MHLRIAPMLESTEGAVRTTFALLRQFECLALGSAANVFILATWPTAPETNADPPKDRQFCSQGR
jgi:hypothetical protein